MRIGRFEWDADNLIHIARHHVSPDEIEEVFDQKYLLLRTKKGRYLALGETSAGRHLTVVFELMAKNKSIRAITARDMDYKERKYYRKN
jgi:uncharacterized DUF497 family protein